MVQLFQREKNYQNYKRMGHPVYGWNKTGIIEAFGDKNMSLKYYVAALLFSLHYEQFIQL